MSVDQESLERVTLSVGQTETIKLYNNMKKSNIPLVDNDKPTMSPRRSCNSIHSNHRLLAKSLAINGIRRVVRLISLACVTLFLLSTFISSTSGTDTTTTTTGKLSEMANRLSSGRSKLVKNLDLSKSSSQINDWLVHQVAPAMATKIIDNVLQSPGQKSSSIMKKPKSTSIDTQALADKIVDKLADSIKKRKNANESLDEKRPIVDNESTMDATHEANKSTKGSNRKGKSLVSDSVQQVVQSLFSKDNRKFFGRAMEKSKFPLRSLASNQIQSLNHNHYQSGGSYHQGSSGSSRDYNNNNSFQQVRDTAAYEQPSYVSTDSSSQLDENPVVLRAEHGHNSTTASPPHRHQYNKLIQNNIAHNENLSPLISSLMSSSSTNQLGNKLLQSHRNQQKYVHTNRHSQHHLAPKPWPSANNPQGVRRNQQQQSPYSLPVTSDINIVQAPSSPAPPPIASTTQPTTTTTTSTTTTSNPVPPVSFVPLNQSNKFKINNRHQHPSISAGSSSSWNHNSRNQYQSQANSNYQQRYQHRPLTTSTSTTTTTTTTTTPEPTETESMMDPIEEETSAPASSIISAVVQSGLESLSQAASQQNSLEDSQIYNSYSNSSYTSTTASSPSSSSSSSSSSAIKGASPASTTARHSVLSAEAIPTALGAPLYHLTRANFTATSIMAPPPRRNGASPAAKAAAKYLQKGLTSLSSTIFGRQNKNWARRLGLSSVLLSGLLYGATMLANPGAPLPTNGFDVLQALASKKRRRGSKEPFLAVDAAKLPIPSQYGPVNTALLDASNGINILYQQPQLIPIIEHLIKQEQLQQSSSFSQRSSLGSNPIEIESFEDQEKASRRDSPSQYYTIRAVPNIISESINGGHNRLRLQSTTGR